MVTLRTLCVAARTLRATLVTSACAVALLACGGGSDTSESSGRGLLDESTGAPPSIVLDPPQTIGASDRIQLTWQAQGAQSFAVFVQHATDQPFEKVSADIGTGEARFARGAAWKFDFPTAKVRVRACNAAQQCVSSNEQAMESVLLASVAQLTSTDPTQFVNFGDATALSADGNTMAVSTGPSPTGSVTVFHRGSDRLWQRAAQLQRQENDAIESFGGALALSGDGRTLAVLVFVPIASVPLPLPPIFPREGSVRVFTRDAQDRWLLQTVIRSTPAEDLLFGRTLALSHDGGRLAVGGFERTTLFQRDAGRWQQVFQTSAIGTLALSPNGNALAVGWTDSDFDEQTAVPVIVFEPCPCGSGWHRVAEIRTPVPPPDASGFVFDGFGASSLAFSGDGKMLAIGAPGDSLVYLFAAGDGGWTQRARLSTPTADDRLGVTVKMSADGRLVAAGARGLAVNTPGVRRNHRAGDEPAPTPEPHSAPAIYFFEPDAQNQWQRTAATLLATFALADHGTSISLSADGMVYGAGFLPRVGITGTSEVERVLVY